MSRKTKSGPRRPEQRQQDPEDEKVVSRRHDPNDEREEAEVAEEDILEEHDVSELR